MLPTQNARHTLGLVLASVGSLGVLVGVGCALGAVVAVFDGGGGAVVGLGGCSLVTLFPSAFLLRRGIAMRQRAIAAGSTLHLDGDTWAGGGGVPTTRSGTKRPSFLNDKEPEDN